MFFSYISLFNKSSSGVYGILSAIILSLLVLVVGVAITLAISVLHKIKNQNSLDLSVVSASAACLSSKILTNDDQIAVTYGNKVGEQFFKQNNAFSSTNYSLIPMNDCGFRASNDVRKTQILIASDVGNGSSVMGGASETVASFSSSVERSSAEVLFVLDASFSMNLVLSGYAKSAASYLQDAVVNSINQIFDSFSPDNIPRFAATHLSYSRVINHQLYFPDTGKQAGYSNNRQQLIDTFKDKYSTQGDTNIYLGMITAMEKAERGYPDIMEDKHKEIIVLMSDGVSNIKTSDPILTVQPDEKMLLKQEICNGEWVENGGEVVVTPEFIDGVEVGATLSALDGTKICTGKVDRIYEMGPNPHAGKVLETRKFDLVTEEADIITEKEKVISKCQEFAGSGTQDKERIIFSVFYETAHEHIDLGRETMEGCASSEEYFYSAQNPDELLAAFTDIADNIVAITESSQPVSISK